MKIITNFITHPQHHEYQGFRKHVPNYTEDLKGVLLIDQLEPLVIKGVIGKRRKNSGFHVVKVPRIWCFIFSNFAGRGPRLLFVFCHDTEPVLLMRYVARYESILVTDCDSDDNFFDVVHYLLP